MIALHMPITHFSNGVGEWKSKPFMKRSMYVFAIRYYFNLIYFSKQDTCTRESIKAQKQVESISVAFIIINVTPLHVHHYFSVLINACSNAVTKSVFPSKRWVEFIKYLTITTLTCKIYTTLIQLVLLSIYHLLM